MGLLGMELMDGLGVRGGSLSRAETGITYSVSYTVIVTGSSDSWSKP